MVYVGLAAASREIGFMYSYSLVDYGEWIYKKKKNFPARLLPHFFFFFFVVNRMQPSSLCPPGPKVRAHQGDHKGKTKESRPQTPYFSPQRP